MTSNKLLLTLLLVLAPSIGWGMDCVDIKNHDNSVLHSTISKCIDNDVTCYITGGGYKYRGISCIKNQGENNDK